MNRHLLFLVLLFIPGNSWSQELPPTPPIALQEEEKNTIPLPSVEPEDLIKTTMAQDIASGDYYQLLSWVKSLGLDSSGGVADLRTRLYAHFKVTPLASGAESDQTITIETAYGTKYFTIEKVDENYIRLTGGVSLNLRDNKQKVDHHITADEILFNQTKNNMTARGRVVYKMVKDGTNETFRGDSLSFNLDDWKGIFYDGVTSRKRSVSGSELDFNFAGDTIKRNQNDMVVMEQGVITSSIPSSPYYRIQAEKIWVMAPGEWGLFNAVLYVGRIPMFYFPFFYQPGDEMFFNPVLGLPTKPDRRGSYLQTTTYLLGTKKKDASPLSFLQVDEGGTTGNKTEIRGLYLVKPATSAGIPPQKPESKDDLMKIIVDIYSNLGAYAAWEGSLSNLGPLKKITFLTAMAASVNVYSVGTGFSPFSTGSFKADQPLWNQLQRNESYFFNYPIPFRLALELGMDTDWVKLNWEYYSDPFMSSDFRDRTENFSMFSLIGFGAKSTTVSEKSSLYWKAEFILSPSLTFLSPWIKTLTVSNVKSSLEWMKTPNTRPIEDPSRFWFAPIKLAALSMNLSISGDLLGSPSANISNGSTEPPKDPINDLLLLPEITAPWSSKENTEISKTSDIETPLDEPLSPGIPLNPPNIQGNLSITNLKDNTLGDLSLTYTYSPRFNQQTFFNQDLWTKPEDMDWKTKYSQTYLNEEGRVGLKWSLGGQLLIYEQSMNYVRNTRLSYGFTESMATTLKNSHLTGDAQYNNYKLNQSLKLSMVPFLEISQLKSTQVSYTLTSKLWENKYTGFDTPNLTGNYDYIYPEWTKNGVTSHELTSNVVINPFSKQELLSSTTYFRTTLEPREIERSLTETLSSQWGLIRASASSGLKYTLTDKNWKRDPLKLNLDLGNETLKVVNSLDYDFDKSDFTSFSSNLSGLGFNMRYSASYGTPYNFRLDSNNNYKWIADIQQSFIHKDVQISYRFPIEKALFWKNRIEVSGGINSSLSVDLQRFTSSLFGFDMNLSVKIFQVFDLTFSSHSNNKSIFRYSQVMVDSLSGKSSLLNPWEDLLKSFYFWDEESRKKS
ncbi:MAG: hypothetical protein A2Z96_04700, partial [Spirochaetes bacterium GWB1_48_6]